MNRDEARALLAEALTEDVIVPVERGPVLDALLPIVDRIAAARAADVWNEAASIGGYYSQQHGPVVPLWVLRDRAAALRAEHRP